MLNRRIFTATLGAWSLAACTARNPAPEVAATAPPRMLVADTPEPYPIAPAGTIVVDADAKFLWLVLEGGQAMRYGVGVGREGFAWKGRATVARKAAWPTWTPPREMIAREPQLVQWASGMPGGPENPLGARALYLYEGRVDTLYRIHGTAEPWSIGRSVSSGCVRLLNADVVDLHSRVPVGSRVLVRPSSGVAV